MRALKIITSLFLLFSSAIAVPAQDDSGFSSTVNWFYSACEDRMVIDLEGTMQSGYDLYFQAFDLFGGLGEAITGLRRISVNGDYSVSQEINWLNGESRALGTPISVVIRIGSELDPDSTLFQQPSDDYLGECEEPGSTLIAGSDVADDPRMVSSAGVFTPDGSMLNPVYTLPPEPIVQIGARPSVDINVEPGRTADPGLIFAECREVEGADPGVLYDTDELRVFWSWYAKTRAQVQDHLRTSQYAIRLYGQTIPNVQISEIKQIPGSINWWVFYTVNFGAKWQPDDYHIEFSIGWTEPITDGYEDFGPGTENERLGSGCQFTIQPNPWGVAVLHEQPSIPLKTYN